MSLHLFCCCYFFVCFNVVIIFVLATDYYYCAKYWCITKRHPHFYLGKLRAFQSDMLELMGTEAYGVQFQEQFGVGLDFVEVHPDIGERWTVKY